MRSYTSPLNGLAGSICTWNVGGAPSLGAWWLPFAVSAVACIALGVVMAAGEKRLRMPFQADPLADTRGSEGVTVDVATGEQATKAKRWPGVWKKLRSESGKKSLPSPGSLRPELFSGGNKTTF